MLVIKTWLYRRSQQDTGQKLGVLETRMIAYAMGSQRGKKSREAFFIKGTEKETGH